MKVLQAAILVSIVPVAILLHAYSTASPKEYHSAAVLGNVGPHGRAAYQAAMADGRITNAEMRLIRQAAILDVDATYQPPAPVKHGTPRP